jgi:hypothetical protein
MPGERNANLELFGAITEKIRMKVMKSWSYRYLGEICLNLGGSLIAESEHWIRKAIEMKTKNGMQFELGFSHALYAEFFKRQGEMGKAKEEFGMATGILKDCGADGWVEKYEKEAAEL